MVCDPNAFTLFRSAKSPYWYYYVYRGGKKVWRSTGEKVKTKALGVIIERMTNGNILEDMELPENTRFDDFANNFWNYDTCPYIQEKIKRGGRFSREQALKYQSRLDRYIMPEFKSKTLLSINRQFVNDWFIGLPGKYSISYKTCNDILSELKIIMDYAVYKELLTTNPARTVKQFTKSYTPRGCYTDTEVREIFSVQWENIYAYTACRLAETTGLRMGEILALKRKNLCCREDLQGNRVDYLHITSSYSLKEGFKCTKSGKIRDIKIHPKIRQMLLSLPTMQETIDPEALIFSINRQNPISKKTVLENLRRAMDDVGIDWQEKNLSFHSFRHFANSHYIPVLGGERTRMLIGHESEAMTKNYLHDTDEDYKQITQLQEKLLSI